MRYANHVSVIPPADWLAHSVLLYDKILFHDDILNPLHLDEPYRLKLSSKQYEDFRYLISLLQNENISDSFVGSSSAAKHLGRQLLYSDNAMHHSSAGQVVLGYYNLDSEFGGAKIYFDEYSSATIEMPESMFPNADTYFPGTPFSASAADSQIVFSTIQALIPLSSDKIDPAQIQDFREANKFTRLEFLKASESIIADIKNATTEAETKRITADLTDYMQVQLQRMRKQYKECLIKTGIKSITSASAGVGALGLIESFTHLPIEPTAALTAATALWLAQSLIDGKNNLEPLKTDKWAYLWNLDRTLK